MQLKNRETLPVDSHSACLVGRAWIPNSPQGPSPVWIHDGNVYDLAPFSPTVSELLEKEPLVETLQSWSDLELIGSLEELLDNTPHDQRDSSKPWFLAPCDLQAIKASGVTFVSSMLERVIEEQARGDWTKAEEIRKQIHELVGDNLAEIQPGSASAMKVKEVLIKQGAWSQYLEVGIGPDAEIFTKSQPMSAVGTGAEVGIHPGSHWNNPEPEIVLAVNSKGKIVGTALGNDVNLRDFEGRSALLLGKAKDNNASCAIGPFIRLFDDQFSLDDVRQANITLSVEGPEGFTLEGSSSMKHISRDPLELVQHCAGSHHQYPDGLMLFLGTMFSPIQDRDEPGQGFTHKVGDIVYIQTPLLGSLINRVNTCDQIPPWTFGTGALMRNLAQRGLL
ncbi:MAG TPA: fumarylacetoacetate hydrolase [Deltaproteobacteria bacterium]|jgi:fumarylacetoacetate (FAA) hydrolase family protein|nr:fumarylacetoacetate hydrolase [Deltaproteobacteria bacterium]MDE0908697.1 fumarylacetoacetate hydrolase family protein [SAR324 cluster bacterium]HIF69616.1 fumarylacetoacetate hydrolase [Candidatus Lambdaproteobacteria bacterium]HIL17135.1 fumarylacetoacetate hydrolase [Deltaproteobacteria bacterium]|tara:strand:- start:4677 stop:5852 length:1176 start_codon:yes stop_codon:yes gene_type:complete